VNVCATYLAEVATGSEGSGSGVSANQRYTSYLAPNHAVVVFASGEATEHPATLEHLHPGRSLGLHLDDPSWLDGLASGKAICIRFTRDHDAAYLFTAPLLDTRPDSHAQLWVAWPTAVHRVQARRHVRLHILVDLTWAPAGPRRLSSIDAERPWRTGRTLDLSAGGLSLFTDDDLRVGSVLIVQLQIPGRTDPVELAARTRVVRAELPAGGQGERPGRLYGLEYLDLGSRQEADIVASVFWHLSKSRLA